jgi:hypothetical protein
VERLLLGRKVRPMLRPDQHQVELYGETFTRGHPAIFEYQAAQWVRRVGKGTLAPCPPSIRVIDRNGGHASLCPPYEVTQPSRAR